MPLSIVNSTPATAFPVTLPDMKLHLRVDDSDQDDIISGCIQSATKHVESVTGQALITSTWQETFDAFPACFIPLRSPLVAVTSITYIDLAGSSQTLAADQYTVDTTRQRGRIVEAYQVTWPSTRAHINVVTLTYTAGHGTAPADVPQPIRQAIMLMAAHWYEHPEGVVVGTIATELPMAVKDLLASYRLNIV